VVRAVSHEIPRVSCYSGTPLNAYFSLRLRDYHPLWSDFPDRSTGLFQLEAPATPGRTPVWAFPLSLAATDGIHVCLFSSRYLDVSVPWVRSYPPMHSAERTPEGVSFLIRKSPDRRSFASSPELIAGYHVLHRLSMPRHPPYTLSSLTTFIDHRHPPFSTCDFRPAISSDTPQHPPISTNLPPHIFDDAPCITPGP
jgi:hypothetical protein